MSTYRLLAGRHIQGSTTHIWNKNPLIESKENLVKKFGFQKFARVEGSGNASPEATTPDSDGLQEMTKKDLVKLSEEEEIDLDGANTKSEIINTIRLALDTK